MIARTGYTGEDGFEIYMPAEKAPEMWEVLMKAGEIDGLMPCGLGARDTLRLEAAMPLYGHEKASMDVTAMDVAKALLDYGIHPPTMYFPLIVHVLLLHHRSANLFPPLHTIHTAE